MALFTAFLLTALYGIAHPLSRRFEGVESWLLGRLLPDDAGPSAVSRVRSFMARGGWSILASSELWLLLLLAWAIAVFEYPAFAFGLLPLGFGLRFFADRWVRYPTQLAWYLSHFERRVAAEAARAHRTEDPDRALQAEALLEQVRELRQASGSLTIRTEA
jgi:hypothetical protein